jgi:manganese/zinc/iron transport system permease protein
VRLHRLWELYLTEYLHLAPDHVHDDAETMEHIITPEIEKQLENRLQKPKYDPHHTEIPYH